MLKREYVVPLRRKVRTAPKWRRSKKSIVVLKDFMKQHMKAEDVIVCKELNEAIWENGIKNPPGKVKVISANVDVGGVIKTVVNLASVGIDSQLELYKTVAAPAASPVEDAQVSEKEETKVESDEVKEEAKAESSDSKEETKKEVKKDE